MGWRPTTVRYVLNFLESLDWDLSHETIGTTVIANGN